MSRRLEQGQRWDFTSCFGVSIISDRLEVDDGERSSSWMTGSVHVLVLIDRDIDIDAHHLPCACVVISRMPLHLYSKILLLQDIHVLVSCLVVNMSAHFISGTTSKISSLEQFQTPCSLLNISLPLHSHRPWTVVVLLV